MERKSTVVAPILNQIPVNPVFSGLTSQIKRDKDSNLKSANVVNIGAPDLKARQGNTPLYIISEKSKVKNIIDKASPIGANSPPISTVISESRHIRVSDRKNFEIQRESLGQKEVSSDEDTGYGQY